jgi:hypothetical protein
VVALALLACALLEPATASSVAVPIGNIEATVSASIAPDKFPRSTEAPVALHLGFTSGLVVGTETPELSQIALEISRNVIFQTAGLPSCPIGRLTSYGNARQTCARSLVGQGSLVTEFTLPGKTPAIVHGHILAFYNEEELGTKSVPHILAQVRTGGEEPLTYVLPFKIQKAGRPFGARLVIPRMRRIRGRLIYGGAYNFKGIYGRISSFELSLHRRFVYNGKKQSFVSAECLSGVNGSQFPLMGLGLRYANGSVVSGVAIRNCKVR